MELTHTPTDTERVLHALQAHPGEWVENLYERTRCMVHSRVADLRTAGHLIECKRFGRKDWRYRII